MYSGTYRGRGPQQASTVPCRTVNTAFPSLGCSKSRRARRPCSRSGGRGRACIRPRIEPLNSRTYASAMCCETHHFNSSYRRTTEPALFRSLGKLTSVGYVLPGRLPLWWWRVEAARITVFGLRLCFSEEKVKGRPELSSAFSTTLSSHKRWNLCARELGWGGKIAARFFCKRVGEPSRRNTHCTQALTPP